MMTSPAPDAPAPGTAGAASGPRAIPVPADRARIESDIRILTPSLLEGVRRGLHCLVRRQKGEAKRKLYAEATLLVRRQKGEAKRKLYAEATLLIDIAARGISEDDYIDICRAAGPTIVYAALLVAYKARAAAFKDDGGDDFPYLAMLAVADAHGEARVPADLPFPAPGDAPRRTGSSAPTGGVPLRPLAPKHAARPSQARLLN